MDHVFVQILEQPLFSNPTKMICNSDGDLLVCEQSNHSIVHFNIINAESGLSPITSIAGERARASDDINSERLLSPKCFAFFPPSTLYICESGRHCIKRFDILSKKMEIIVGNGVTLPEYAVGHVPVRPGPQCQLRSPQWISVTNNESMLAISEGATKRLLILSPSSLLIVKSMLIPVKPTAVEFIFPSIPSSPLSLLLSESSNDSLEHSRTHFLFISTHFGIESVPISEKCLYNEYGPTLQPNQSQNSSIPPLSLVCGRRDTKGFADGPKFEALFDCVLSILFNSSETILYIADCNNNRIRMLDFSTEMVSTLAGSGHWKIAGGYASQASFFNPNGLCWLNGSDIVVSNCIKKGNLSIITDVEDQDTYSDNIPRLFRTLSSNRFYLSF